MRILVTLVMFSIFLICAFHSTGTAQDQPTGKVHGYVFGDYYYKVQGDSSGSGSQYSSVKKAAQAFQFRRFYLYYEQNLSEKFFAQFLLEGNDKALDPGGKHGVFVKTAFLEWKEIIPLGGLLLGLVPTPTWSLLSEKVWNYRSIEKTIIDYRALGSASDIGIMLRGKFDSAGTVNYVAMIGNGNGQKPENDKFKKYYLSLSAKPIKEFVVEGYADYQPAAADKNKTTLKGFAAYKSADLTVGAEVFQQMQEKARSGGADVKPFGVSLFAWAPISGVSKLNVFARFDYYDPDTEDSDSGFTENFITAGLDFMPLKDVHFMPNVWVNTFSDKSPANISRDADVVVRMTFFYIYK